MWHCRTTSARRKAGLERRYARCATRSGTADPDDEGYHVDGGCALGMRRLSIIDLSTGHQPMSNEDGIGLGGLQRRDLQLSRNCARFDSRRPSLRHRIATPRRWFTFMKKRARPASRSCAACSRMPSGMRGGRRCCWRAIASARSRCTYAIAAGRVIFWQRAEMPARGRSPAGNRREALRLYFQFNYIPDPWSPFPRDSQTGAGRLAALRRRRNDGARVDTGGFPRRRPSTPPKDSRNAACEQLRERSTKQCGCA